MVQAVRGYLKRFLMQMRCEHEYRTTYFHPNGYLTLYECHKCHKKAIH